MLNPERTGAGSGTQPATLLVTIRGPGGQSVRRVPADTPLAAVVASLGAAAGVDRVGRVTTLQGRALAPTRSLTASGIRPGATLIIEPVPGAESGVRAPSSSATAGWGGPAPETGPLAGERLPSAGVLPRPAPADLFRSTNRPRRARQRLVVAVAVTAAVCAGAGVGIGLAVSGGGTSARSVAMKAATAWVDGTAYRGRLGPGVATDLGRRGPIPGGRIAADGTAGADQLVRVMPPLGADYDLAVLVSDRIVEEPLTPAATPPLGAAVPETGPSTAPPSAAAVKRWAQVAFAPGSALGRLGFTWSGTAKVVSAWRSGDLTVGRVLVHLRWLAAGSPSAQRLDSASSAAAAAAAQTSTDLAALTAALQDLNTAKIAAAAKPHTETQKEHQAAQLAAAQLAVGHAQDNYRAAEASLVSADATYAKAEAVSDQITGVYDVTFTAAGQPLAWDPAGGGS